MSTKKVKKVYPQATCAAAEVPSAPLKKQSSWSREKWKPGEVPARGFAAFIAPLDAPEVPYGHGYLGVQHPKGYGNGAPISTTDNKE